MAEYASGKCNINSEEVRMRYDASLVMFLIVSAFIGMLFYYPVSGTDVYSYVALFFITISASLMYLQSRNSFCVGLALKGEQKTGEDVEKVEDGEKIRQDWKKAFMIFGQSVAFSAVLTGLVYLAVTFIGFLPVLG